MVTITEEPQKLLLKCDWCGLEFQRPYSQGRIRNDSHYCTRKCQGLGTRKKRENTNIIRYGESSAMKTQPSKEKLRRTLRERYGVDVPSLIIGSEEKKQETCVERYGVAYPLQSKIIDDKRKQTCLQRYGRSTVLNTKKSRERNTSRECQRKKHETMKRNGTYGSSIPEEHCFKILCEQYGQENVKRQVFVNKWPIDFYVVPIDTYIQFDGTYWHGLDRPISEIARHKTPRDKQIHKKWLTDREQDKWFADNKIKLLRISDVSELSPCSP